MEEAYTVLVTRGPSQHYQEASVVTSITKASVTIAQRYLTNAMFLAIGK